MATEAPGAPPELVAVAFVVEASLTVANEWPRIIVDYISPMLKRVMDTNPGYKPRMGFVTYATADMAPSPILCKRFFADPHLVTKEMKESPAKLGIGQTNSGGGMGMAALEGFVAAIELFDILVNVYPQNGQHTRANVHHLIHIASAPPDDFTHPHCNNSILLDRVTWEDMPNELKKRNIHFSSINLRPNLPRFSEVHSAAAAGAPQEPWFTVRPTHTVMLASFPVPLPRAAKRPGEVQTNERQPENKRPRVGNHSDSSTNAVTPKTPVMQPKQTQVSPSQAMPPPAVTTAAPPPQPSVQGPNAQYQMLMANMAGLREQIRSLSASLDNARNTGNATLTQGIQQELNKKKGMYQKFEQVLAAYHQKAPAHVKAQAQALQAALQTRLQNQGASTAGPSDQKVAPSFPPDPIPSTAAPPEESRRDGQDVGQTNQNQPPNTSGPLMTTSQPRVPIPPGTTPAMASQIHQMVQQLTRPLEGLSQHPSLPQNTEMKPAGAAVQPREGSAPSPPVWQGSLSWNGVSPAGRKEMMAFVIASTSHGAMSRAETWPKALTLVPSRDAVPIQELQVWLKRHRPVVCSITAQPNVPDPKGNEANLQSLVLLLGSKNIYATAAWPRPSGEQGNNVLFFPISSGLAGAFFPVKGIPEIPGAVGHPLNSLPPEAIAKLQAMSPEQREKMMTQIKLKHQRELHLQQQQKQAMVNNNGAGGPSGSGGAGVHGMFGMNMMAQQRQQQQQQVQHGDLGFGGGVPNFGGGMNMIGMGQQGTMMNAGMRVPSNINQEMMQSFMQRNSDGSSGMTGP